MTLSAYIPTWRGWLALSVGFANAMIVPALIPAYDGPGASIFDGCVAVLLATVTLLVCFHSLHRTRLPDKLLGILSAAFSIWIFYVFVQRAA